MPPMRRSAPVQVGVLPVACRPQAAATAPRERAPAAEAAKLIRRGSRRHGATVQARTGGSLLGSTRRRRMAHLHKRPTAPIPS